MENSIFGNCFHLICQNFWNDEIAIAYCYHSLFELTYLELLYHLKIRKFNLKVIKIINNFCFIDVIILVENLN